MWPFDRKERAWTKAVVDGLRASKSQQPMFPVAEKYKKCAEWAVDRGFLIYPPGLGNAYVQLNPVQQRTQAS